MPHCLYDLLTCKMPRALRAKGNWTRPPLFRKNCILFETVVPRIVSEHEVTALKQPKYSYVRTYTIRPLSWAVTGQGGRGKAGFRPPLGYVKSKLVHMRSIPTDRSPLAGELLMQAFADSNRRTCEEIPISSQLASVASCS
jgi:hypothetical protein